MKYLPCPTWKVCDLNNSGWINLLLDINIFNRILNNSLTSCNIGCGNGKIDLGEQCDDGNLMSGDGCSANCKLEPGDAPLEYCKIIANPNPAVEWQPIQFITEWYAPWADTYSYTITDWWMGGGISSEPFLWLFPIGIPHFAGK